MRAIIKADELQHPPAPWQPGPPSSEASPAPEALSAPPSEPQPTHERDRDADLARQAYSAREQGLAQGIRAAEESYRAKLARLDALSASLQQERAEFFSRIEPELVRLAIAIAEKTIQRELETQPDTVLHLLRTALKRIRDREHLRISVNPRDFDQVKQARDDLISAVDGLRKLEIVEDRRVGPGGSLIESPSGTLDARIDTQLDQISQALIEAIPESAADESAPPDRQPGSGRQPDSGGQPGSGPSDEA
jgi:flagellar biosynthesis/type III secretory pathway protein FliH